MVRSYDIAAYTYGAEVNCGPCVIERMIQRREASPGARSMNVEQALTQIAEANAIDRFDEWSFDSDDFPKVVFHDQITEGEACYRCGGEL